MSAVLCKCVISTGLLIDVWFKAIFLELQTEASVLVASAADFSPLPALTLLRVWPAFSPSTFPILNVLHPKKRPKATIKNFVMLRRKSIQAYRIHVFRTWISSGGLTKQPTVALSAFRNVNGYLKCGSQFLTHSTYVCFYLQDLLSGIPRAGKQPSRRRRVRWVDKTSE